MRIGLILKCHVPTIVAAKRKQLIQNCQGFNRGVLKFSGVISKSVAAPRRPTTAGLRPEKTFCTTGVFMYFIKILAIKIISISEGNTSANVAVTLPNTDIQ